MSDSTTIAMGRVPITRRPGARGQFRRRYIPSSTLESSLTGNQLHTDYALQHRGRRHHLGTFETEEEAARAPYDAAAERFKGARAA